jgi:hypothetical protein
VSKPDYLAAYRSRCKHSWSAEEDAYLRENYSHISTRQIAADLHRTENAVRNRSSKTNLSFPRAPLVRGAKYEAFVHELCAGTKLSPVKVLAGVRWRPLVRIRWRAWQRLRDEGHSFPQIAEVSGFDHSSVIYGLARLEQLQVAE